MEYPVVLTAAPVVGSRDGSGVDADCVVDPAVLLVDVELVDVPAVLLVVVLFVVVLPALVPELEPDVAFAGT